MYTIQQVAKAADLTRRQLEAWVSRDFIVPEHVPAPGTARMYSLLEAMRVAVVADLVRLGIPVERAADATRWLHAFKDDAAILVIWQGPVQLIPASERGTRPLSDEELRKSGAAKFYNPDAPPIQSEIVKKSAFAAFVDDPDKRAVAHVNIDHIEARVKRSLDANA